MSKARRLTVKLKSLNEISESSDDDSLRLSNRRHNETLKCRTKKYSPNNIDDDHVRKKYTKKIIDTTNQSKRSIIKRKEESNDACWNNLTMFRSDSRMKNLNNLNLVKYQYQQHMKLREEEKNDRPVLYALKSKHKEQELIDKRKEQHTLRRRRRRSSSNQINNNSNKRQSSMTLQPCREQRKSLSTTRRRIKNEEQVVTRHHRSNDRNKIIKSTPRKERDEKKKKKVEVEEGEDEEEAKAKRSLIKSWLDANEIVLKEMGSQNRLENIQKTNRNETNSGIRRRRGSDDKKLAAKDNPDVYFRKRDFSLDQLTPRSQVRRRRRRSGGVDDEEKSTEITTIRFSELKLGDDCDRTNKLLSTASQPMRPPPPQPPPLLSHRKMMTTPHHTIATVPTKSKSKELLKQLATKTKPTNKEKENDRRSTLMDAAESTKSSSKIRYKRPDLMFISEKAKFKKIFEMHRNKQLANLSQQHRQHSEMFYGNNRCASQTSSHNNLDCFNSTKTSLTSSYSRSLIVGFTSLAKNLRLSYLRAVTGKSVKFNDGISQSLCLCLYISLSFLIIIT